MNPKHKIVARDSASNWKIRRVHRMRFICYLRRTAGNENNAVYVRDRRRLYQAGAEKQVGRRKAGIRARRVLRRAWERKRQARFLRSRRVFGNSGQTRRIGKVPPRSKTR
jgi:hypothetical protein